MPGPEGIDMVIHAPHRLQICAILSAVEGVEFSALREMLAVSDSALSKHLATLESAGYVTTTRRAREGRSRVWVSMTTAGSGAYHGHVQALRQLIDSS
jgi:DNA-binding MarR family transcriptional regulator